MILKAEAERLKIEFMHRVLPKRLGQRDQLIFQVMEARYEEIIAMLFDKVSSEIEAATTVKVICVGGGYQPSFVDPIVKRCLNNSVIVHVGDDANSEAQEHWLAAQLFEYASIQQSQSKRGEQASVKQWLRRCKHWFEYHF